MIPLQQHPVQKERFQWNPLSGDLQTNANEHPAWGDRETHPGFHQES
jgi:hypothetical protein